MASGPQTPSGYKKAIEAAMAELNQLLRDAYNKADVHTSIEDISERTDQKLKLPQFKANVGIFSREGERPATSGGLAPGVQEIK